MAYNLDALGWLQFERLCDQALALTAGVDPGLWSGAADEGRIAVVEDGVSLPLGLGRVDGPAAIVTWWSGHDAPPLDPSIVAGTESAPSVVLVTNLPADAPPAPVAAVIGAEQLAALLDAEPALRLRVPAALGVRALDGMAPRDTVAASTFDVRAAHGLARIFVATRAYDHAVDVLERHHFVVLTGPPEVGKTAIATAVGLARLTAGWEVHDCTSPDQVLTRHAPGRSQAFIADDAFGSTEYRPDAAERWARELPRILTLLDDRHWLLWTSRPAPLRAGLYRVHLERGGEHFPSPAQVHVDAAALDLDEKASILLRHAKAAGLDRAVRRLVRDRADEIVGHPQFTPERIRRFVERRLGGLAGATPWQLRTAIEEELGTPTEAMATSLHALDAEHRDVLTALLDAPPGPVSDRELAASLRRHRGNGLSRTPAELIDRLADHFLRVLA